MAYYKYAQFLQQQQGPEFDQLHWPGHPTPHSGVYRCTGCGLSMTSIKDKPFPPQNSHQHQNALVPIQWQLIVKSHFTN